MPNTKGVTISHVNLHNQLTQAENSLAAALERVSDLEAALRQDECMIDCFARARDEFLETYPSMTRAWNELWNKYHPEIGYCIKQSHAGEQDVPGA